MKPIPDPEAEAHKSALILVVDDEEPARHLLARILEEYGYRCNVASDAREARSLLAENEYSLVLTDMDMPGESGLDLITDIAVNSPDIGTIMVTGRGHHDLATRVISSGAYGYISKPIDPDEVYVNVLNALRRRSLQLENRKHRERLEELVKHRTDELWETCLHLERSKQEVQASREETIQRLALAAEFRDTETAKHVERMSRYCELLSGLTDHDGSGQELIRLASLLHDVGKIAVPDTILLKPGPLTAEERRVMQQHAQTGYEMLTGSSSNLLQLAATIAWTHHERWDGTGYPKGLAGEQIPVSARIAGIADVFDALTSDRVYRGAFEVSRAAEIMGQERYSQFDGDLLDLFLASLDKVAIIREMHQDVPTSS